MPQLFKKKQLQLAASSARGIEFMQKQVSVKLPHGSQMASGAGYNPHVEYYRWHRSGRWRLRDRLCSRLLEGERHVSDLSTLRRT